MQTENVVSDYGWTNSKSPCAHSYLEPALIAICEALNVRRILDLGCGNGALTHSLARAGFAVVGCDADEKAIALARQDRSSATFEQVSVYDSPSRLNAVDFDLVISAEVVEHLFLPRSLPRFAHAALRANGHFVITTPYHGYLKNLVLALLGKWDGHHDPLWDGGHIKFWSRATLSKLLEDEGFVVEQFRGVGRMPFLWKSMLLTARKQ